MLWSLKNFKGQLCYFEMMVYVWENFKTILQFQFGGAPPPPAIYQNLVPAHDHFKDTQVAPSLFRGKKKRIFQFDCVTWKKIQQAHPGDKCSSSSEQLMVCVWTHVNGQYTLTKNAAGSPLLCECLFHKWQGGGGCAFPGRIRERRVGSIYLCDLDTKKLLLKTCFAKHCNLFPIKVLYFFSLGVSSGPPHFRR